MSSKNYSSSKKKGDLYSITKTYFRHANHYLTKKQVEEIFRAAEKAYYFKTPLNRFFTLCLDQCVDRRYPQKEIASILGNTRKWLKRREISIAYVWVIEDSPIIGLHVHLMIHIPAGHQIEYKRALKKWLPFEWSKERINVQATQHPIFGNLHPLNSIYGRLRYTCKGINPQNCINKINPKYQGSIYGRRYGISKFLKG